MARRCQLRFALFELHWYFASLQHHPFNQIHSEHHLGDTVFYLQARIDFQKVEFLCLRIENEFNSSRVAIIDTCEQGFSRCMKLRPKCRVKIGRWTLLDNFLVTPLRGTIPFTERNRVTRTIAKNLHLNMPGFSDGFLQKHTVIGKVAVAKSSNLVKRIK